MISVMKKGNIVVLIIIILSLVSCNDDTTNKSSNQPPKISIVSGDTNIDYAVGMNSWNDSKDTFDTIMKEDSKKLKYINLNEEININFNGDPPDTVKLYDNILDDKGKIKYWIPEIKEIPIEVVDGKCKFILDVNYAVAFSSNLDDYKPGAAIRGFKLICTWAENECEYGFIVRSDPGV